VESDGRVRKDPGAAVSALPPVWASALCLPGAVRFGFAGAKWTPVLAAECYEIKPQSTRRGRSGVYFVVRGDEVVYVGQSVRMEWRAVSHQKKYRGLKFYGLVFDREEGAREELETAFICALLPRDNKQRRTPAEHTWLAVVSLLSEAA